MQVPTRLQHSVSNQFGPAGASWLVEFPGLFQQLCQQWALEPGRPFDGGLGCNFVVPCISNGRSLVLKLCYPQPETLTEIATLKSWRGHSNRVQLVAFDTDAYAILMDRVLPGTMFRAADPATRSTRIPNLFSLVPLPVNEVTELKTFPTYRQWFSRANNDIAAIDDIDAEFAAAFSLASTMLDKVLACFTDTHLLHGDLHHENMLLNADGGYTAIDPKGVLGPAVLEYGRFMHNFVRDEPADIADLVLQRAQSLETSEHPKSWLIRVGFIDLALSISWTLIAGDQLTVERAELLSAYRRLVEREGLL